MSVLHLPRDTIKSRVSLSMRLIFWLVAFLNQITLALARTELFFVDSVIAGLSALARQNQRSDDSPRRSPPLPSNR